ncbi:MAG: RNA polymerase sigma factor [Prosthecobacter sp.]
MSHPISTTDAELLGRYLQSGDESAFAALVRSHERLVIGTAARITGDSELARDVAQLVFATLAQKAWILIDRICLTGWLHHATRHISLRMLRSEKARQRRHEQIDLDVTTAQENDFWPTLEEALAALHESEREAVVMHHLQDLTYPEMATALGLTEAAARKRVSRGLKNLGRQLHKRGFTGSTAALLAGASALQIGAPPFAMATATVSAAPLSLTLNTIMTHTAVKVASVIALAAAAPIAWQNRENSALRNELSTLQQQRPTAAHVTSAVRDNAAARAEAMVLMERLESAARSLAEAQAKLSKTQATVRELDEEVVITMGKIEDLARTMARKRLPMMEAMASYGRLDDDKRSPEQAELFSKILLEYVPEQQTILKLEDRPTDVARFFATVFDDTFGLPDTLLRRVESTLQADFDKLKNDGLSYSQRPVENTEDWAGRRRAATVAMYEHLKELLPPQMGDHPFLDPAQGALNGFGILGIEELASFSADPRATPHPTDTQP